jgi:hypothetical protein
VEEVPRPVGDELGEVDFVDAVVEVPVETKVHGVTSDVTTELQSFKKSNPKDPCFAIGTHWSVWKKVDWKDY